MVRASSQSLDKAKKSARGNDHAHRAALLQGPLLPDRGASRQRLAREFGCARWVRNTCLAGRSDLYRAEGASLTGVHFSRELTRIDRFPGYEGLGETSTILTQKLRDQDCAFVNFFEGRAKYPRFKKKHHAQAIRYPFDQRVVAGMYRPEELLKLPKLGELDVRWSRRQGGIPKLVTVRKDAAGGTSWPSWSRRRSRPGPAGETERYRGGHRPQGPSGHERRGAHRQPKGAVPGAAALEAPPAHPVPAEEGVRKLAPPVAQGGPCTPG